MPEFTCRNQFTLECNFSFDQSCFCTSHPWLWTMHRSRDPALGVVVNSWMKVFHLCSVLQLTYGMLGIITKVHLLRHRRLAKDCLSKAAFLKGFAFFILEIELLLMGFLYCLFFLFLFFPFAVLRSLLLQQSMVLVYPKRMLAKGMDIDRYSLGLDAMRGSLTQSHLESTNSNFCTLLSGPFVC